ncbi:3-methyl-2-oxobutanoate hydroxymethyltransferase [Alkalihalobacillus alcalophilus ATCC 27647 = CGMCC 1.3604]|uniref:3-methyl-2-oxobutanoate hydroxymethyltransferase n=1 Tax=Alkalihalobacillus alcalophilus ATCC 27647 = CGMCC 1.3604 TaxID=1218173 RepID=A0A094WSQ9_ALKAL|nr:3-methyl-2-oxobutanoate hydroxymethyltransferase [Alkalihalobacillus alcalophilus]KGA99113.1 3-methyl-2-oxobutanoate hydroxymethyltransferase [Alkalihalobacillus alcalophilus ATCC 27647 = CGMCC 1.3604]MED1563463.1 3-methyl-2-oxobutanoate hydroxymethyltransferase [Alkalihalobacillus alcalophilus]THG90316.1 3-methyl-2-oxobutanoate hydroxymethyltransferase [Alkalihalobacillus alcalophilus ATCC 27647 = CGMCC 1.3604]
MKTTSSFLKMKQNKEKIAMMTAYDAPAAKLVEQAGVDLILVGDSLGMVVLGYDSTVPVTLDDMVMHTKAVKRGAKDTFVVTDFPFLSYHASIEETFQAAKRLMQEAGAHAVKLEGADELVDTILKLTNAGVPVMGHLGLMPQSVGVLGGYKVQGKDEESAAKLLKDAKAVEEAGAFALVLECVPEQVAAWVTEELKIPVMGIGAGVHTDGQVLVYHDVIGYGEGHVPKFVKKYANVSETIQTAVSSYVEEVKKEQFPQKEHSFQSEVKQVSLYGGN